MVRRPLILVLLDIILVLSLLVALVAMCYYKLIHSSISNVAPDTLKLAVIVFVITMVTKGILLLLHWWKCK